MPCEQCFMHVIDSPLWEQQRTLYLVWLKGYYAKFLEHFSSSIHQWCVGHLLNCIPLYSLSLLDKIHLMRTEEQVWENAKLTTITNQPTKQTNKKRERGTDRVMNNKEKDINQCFFPLLLHLSCSWRVYCVIGTVSNVAYSKTRRLSLQLRSLQFFLLILNCQNKNNHSTSGLNNLYFS